RDLVAYPEGGGAASNQGDPRILKFIHNTGKNVTAGKADPEVDLVHRQGTCNCVERDVGLPLVVVPDDIDLVWLIQNEPYGVGAFDCQLNCRSDLCTRVGHDARRWNERTDLDLILRARGACSEGQPSN